MEGSHKGFLEYLQSLDEPTKKKVLVISTALIMIVVVYFWLAYFNNLIAGITQPQPVAAATADTTSGPSGLAYVGAEFMGAVKGFIGIFRGPHDYIIQPRQ